MTKDEIIAMAREAGIKLSPAQFSGVLEAETDEFALADFAALVAAKEREACAVECSRQAGLSVPSYDTAIACAAAIRARGKP